MSEGVVRVKAWLSSARKVRRATLIRNGEVLGWQDTDAETVAIELVDEDAPQGAHWYCVTAEAESSPDLSRPVLGHASPFFVTV